MYISDQQVVFGCPSLSCGPKGFYHCRGTVTDNRHENCCFLLKGSSCSLMLGFSTELKPWGTFCCYFPLEQSYHGTQEDSETLPYC